MPWQFGFPLRMFTLDYFQIKTLFWGHFDFFGVFFKNYNFFLTIRLCWFWSPMVLTSGKIFTKTDEQILRKACFGWRNEPTYLNSNDLATILEFNYLNFHFKLSCLACIPHIIQKYLWQILFNLDMTEPAWTHPTKSNNLSFFSFMTMTISMKTNQP